MVHVDGPVGLDGVAVVFDDERAVADAGIVLAATLAGRLGIEALVDERVDLGERAGAGNEGAKVMTLISAMALGADCIDDCDLLRSGRTADVLGHRVMAPSTLGTFCARSRSGTSANSTASWARRCSAPGRRVPVPARGGWSSMSTRSSARRSAAKKQGAAFGYTRVRGYHPILATRADTGEVLHIRLRKGSANTSRGFGRFLDELLARVERAGAAGPKLLRADSGFWNNHTFTKPRPRGLAVLDRRAPATRGPGGDRRDRRDGLADAGRLPEHVDRADRRDHARRPAAGRSPRPHARSPRPTAAELGAVSVRHQPQRRLAHRRGRASPARRRRARDPRLKDQALAHFPSGHFYANAAWTVIAALAHNLLRWTSVIGLPGQTIRAARTIRRRLLALPGRLTRTARRWTLHLPARWPWQHDFIRALARIRALPAAA